MEKRKNNVKKQILFIQGGGEGAYEEDEKLAASLQNALGDKYNVLYPKMPNEEDPEYETWKAQITKELAWLDGKVILVGHSVGSSVLLKYLSEQNVEKRLAGIFLIGTPFWGAEDWLASQISTGPPIYFYHSRDDEVIPFAHLAMYAEKLPEATIREFDGRGHQFSNDLSEVAADIKSL
jgi:predicted alpha/beta hydrolase family esterase